MWVVSGSKLGVGGEFGSGLGWMYKYVINVIIHKHVYTNLDMLKPKNVLCSYDLINFEVDLMDTYDMN